MPSHTRHLISLIYLKNIRTKVKILPFPISFSKSSAGCSVPFMVLKIIYLFQGVQVTCNNKKNWPTTLGRYPMEKNWFISSGRLISWVLWMLSCGNKLIHIIGRLGPWIRYTTPPLWSWQYLMEYITAHKMLIRYWS